MSANMANASAQDIVASSESGARQMIGIEKKLFLSLAFLWSVFQIYTASSIPYWLSQNFAVNLVFNNQEVRQIHLAFALVLAMLAFPLFKVSQKKSIPIYDWLLALAAAIVCLYLFFNKEAIASRAGLPTQFDILISALGLMLLAIAVWRSLGLPLVIVASIFVLYVFFGDATFLPETIQWKGASVGKALWHYWMQTEGVFGVALGVSSSLIFLFVLFGALLEKAGAGTYFIQLAFSALGHLRGGPAKAAVVASAASGLYSGSSIANVVTTGTFTIPLMKKTGFSAERAGAVEVASSTNGQLTPPVMGAAAFLIAEFTGISYLELVKHAFLPAVISYIALIYIVHLEALKLGLKGMQKPNIASSFARRMASFIFGFLAMGMLAVAIYYLFGWTHQFFPAASGFTRPLIVLFAYLILIIIAARNPDLPQDAIIDTSKPLPKVSDVAVTGLYFLLPIIVLIWNIMIERLSPALSAYWAMLVMIIIVLSQHAIKNLIRKKQNLNASIKQGACDFFAGMISGARNMIGIGVATGAAGIIVGTVSLTGAHQIIGEFVEYLSGGNLMIMLLLVAIMSLILGMGLPTTANYIVVSSLMAPVIVSVGAQSGLIVPLVAVHLFVFYFGILADDTPPVGLAAFAAAAISQGDPIKTGIQGFAYDIRTALLPFLFIFNTQLLLIDVTFLQAVFIFVVAAIAMMIFAAATQGYFFARSKLWESLILLIVALILLRPGFLLDRVWDKYEVFAGEEIISTIENLPENSLARIVIEGPDFDNPDELYRRTIQFVLGEKTNAQTRLQQVGLILPSNDSGILAEPVHGSEFFTALQKFDFYGDAPVQIIKIEIVAKRIAKEIFYIPAILLLGFVIFLQRRRQTVAAF